MGPGASEASSENRLFRSLAPTQNSQIGFSQSGIVTTGSSLRLPLQRAGSTAGAAVVGGRIWPWSKGRWAEALATPFELSIPSGAADLSVDLRLPDSPTGAPVRTFLVRLEAVTGGELSLFTECRMWLVADTALPRPGGLAMLSLPGPDTAGTLLLGQWLLDSADMLHSPDGLEKDLWQTKRDSSSITLGPVSLFNVSAQEAPQNFFRLRH